MPTPKPVGFRRRAVELARQPGAWVARIALDSGIGEPCLRRGMQRDDVDAGRKDGVTSDEREELLRLRRENRRQAREIEVLKRASAYFAAENVLPRG